MLPLKTVGESLHVYTASGSLLAIFGIPWLVDCSFWSSMFTSPSFSVCLSVSKFPLFIRTSVTFD